MNALWHLLQENIGNLNVRGVFRKVDGDEELLCLSIDISNIDTALMGKENPIALLVVMVSQCARRRSASDRNDRSGTLRPETNNGSGRNPNAGTDRTKGKC